MDKTKIVACCVVVAVAGVEIAHHRIELFFNPVDHVPETPFSAPDYPLKATTVVATTAMSWNTDWIKSL